MLALKIPMPVSEINAASIPVDADPPKKYVEAAVSVAPIAVSTPTMAELNSAAYCPAVSLLAKFAWQIETAAAITVHLENSGKSVASLAKTRPACLQGQRVRFQKNVAEDNVFRCLQAVTCAATFAFTSETCAIAMVSVVLATALSAQMDCADATR